MRIKLKFWELFRRFEESWGGFTYCRKFEKFWEDVKKPWKMLYHVLSCRYPTLVCVNFKFEILTPAHLRNAGFWIILLNILTQ